MPVRLRMPGLLTVEDVVSVERSYGNGESLTCRILELENLVVKDNTLPLCKGTLTDSTATTAGHFLAFGEAARVAQNQLTIGNIVEIENFETKAIAAKDLQFHLAPDVHAARPSLGNPPSQRW